MSDRKPTAKQVDLLRAVRDGAIHAHGGRQGGETFHRQMPDNEYPPVTADVERLVARGWVEREGDYSPGAGVTQMTLTTEGARVLADIEDWMEYAQVLDEWPGVSTRRRARGNHPIAGWGKAPDGREVHCSYCVEARKAEPDSHRGRLYDPVWYTNEGGVHAHRDAERARRDHVLKHAREARDAT